MRNRSPFARRVAAQLLVLLACHPLPAPAQRSSAPADAGRRIALLVGTDTYASKDWKRLSSPVRDASALAATLAGEFRFDTSVIRNAEQAQVQRALLDLKRKATGPNDWVVIFIASHGFFDDDRSQGYLVFRDSKSRASDETLSSYLALTVLLPLLEGYTAGHVLLVIDACYAGTIDRDIRTGTDRGDASWATRREIESSIRRRSQYRSRLFLTSGGKEYVPDGGRDGHSPFAWALLAALREASNDGIPLTFSQLLGGLDRAAVQPLPRHGVFAGHEAGGDFVFVPTSFTSASSAVDSPARAERPEPSRQSRADRSDPSSAPEARNTRESRVPSRTGAPSTPVRVVASSLSDAATLLNTGTGRSFDAASASCNDGDDGLCLAAGRFVLRAHGVARDEARARAFFERGCTRGDSGSCAELALLDARDRSDARRSAAGRGRLRQLCDSADVLACVALARLWTAEGTGGSPGELAGALQTGCASGVAAACTWAALAQPGADGDGVSPDGEALLGTGCKALDTTACALLARLYVERDRSRAERDLAAKLADASCAAYDPVGCNLRAEQLSYGLGADVDFARARLLADRSCQARSGEGCYLLGRMTELGLGGARDARAAARLYSEACTLGVKADCSRSLNPRTQVSWWRAVP